MKECAECTAWPLFIAVADAHCLHRWCRLVTTPTMCATLAAGDQTVATREPWHSIRFLVQQSAGVNSSLWEQCEPGKWSQSGCSGCWVMLSTEITEVQGSQQLVSLLFGVFMITEIFGSRRNSFGTDPFYGELVCLQMSHRRTLLSWIQTDESFFWKLLPK
jgi:hypothetical protein